MKFFGGHRVATLPLPGQGFYRARAHHIGVIRLVRFARSAWNTLSSSGDDAYGKDLKSSWRTTTKSETIGAALRRDPGRRRTE
jgi:hypothetical protein